LEQLYGCSLSFSGKGGIPVIKTKYPVVLVHGMMAKDFPFWHAFRGISDFLEKQKIPVYITNRDGVGNVTNCAQQLKEEILEILKKENCDKVNLIAHSKGGVDARYMISRLGMAEHIASLTTLSSPHHGSRVAVHLLNMPRFFRNILEFSLNTFFRLWGDQNPDAVQMAQDLTPEAMAEFNKNVPDAPGVYYQSYASVAPRAKNPFLLIPYRLSRKWEQRPTDGMVAVESAQWSNYRGCLRKPTDHFHLAGIFGSKKSLSDMGRFYKRIITDLQIMGF
jgi:triacylglycerol lipase